MKSEDLLEFLIKGAFVIVFGTLALLVLTPFAIGMAIASRLSPRYSVFSLSPKNLKATIYRWYYRFFPGQLRKKERREQADLLLEYEEVVRDKELLDEKLRYDAWQLEDFAKKIRQIDDKAFLNRTEGKTAYSAIEKFDVFKLSDFEAIKKKAIARENAVFKIYVICKKLRLYGIHKEMVK